jgi:hypothetical protein
LMAKISFISRTEMYKLDVEGTIFPIIICSLSPKWDFSA